MAYYDVLNGISQFTNAAMNAAQGFAQIASTQLRNQAQIDVQKMQANLNKDINDFMLDLSRKPYSSFEEYQEEVNTFIEKKKSAASDPESPYYIRNNLTGQMSKGMFDSAYENLRNNVLTLGLQKQKESQIYTIQELNNTNIQNDGGAQALKKNIENISMLRSNNYISYVQQQEMNKEAVRNCYNADLSKHMADTIQEGLNAGYTPEEALKKFSKKVDDLGSAADWKDHASDFDIEGTAAKATGDFTARYNAEVKKTQQQHNNIFYKTNTQIIYKAQTGELDGDELVNAIKTQQDVIFNCNNINKIYLDEEDKRRRIQELNGLVEAYTEGGKSTLTKKAYKNALEAGNMDLFLANAINGTFSDVSSNGYSSMYTAMDDYLDYTKQAFMEYYGEDQGNAMFTANKNYIYQKFKAEAIKRVKEQKPELISAINYATELPEKVIESKAFKEIAANDPYFAKKLKDEVNGLAYDYLFANDFSKMTADDIIKKTNDTYSKLFAKSIDLSSNDKISNAESFYENLPLDQTQAEKFYSNKNNFAKAIETASRDYVYSGTMGQDVYLGGEKTKKALQNLEIKEQQALQDMLGTEVKQIGYTPTENGTDKDSTMVFEAGKNVYKFEAENGKVFVRQGEKTEDGIKWDEEAKPYLTAREQAKKEVRDKQKALTRDIMEKETDIGERTRNVMGTNIPLGGYTQEQWDNLSFEARQSLAAEIARNTAKYVDFLRNAAYMEDQEENNSNSKKKGLFKRNKNK